MQILIISMLLYAQPAKINIAFILLELKYKHFFIFLIVYKHDRRVLKR